MMQKQPTASILVRLPLNIKAWIEQEAERNYSSQNGEIIKSILLRMEAAARGKGRRTTDKSE
jgi:hypothetical protein